MKGYRIVKRGLTLALCAMLITPTVQIAGDGLRVEAADEELTPEQRDFMALELEEFYNQHKGAIPAEKQTELEQAIADAKQKIADMSLGKTAVETVIRRVEKQITDSEDPTITLTNSKASAKLEIIDCYNQYLVDIKAAGNEKAASDYVAQMAGAVGTTDAGGVLLEQKTITGVESTKTMVMSRIKEYAVAAPEPEPEPEPDTTPTTSNSNIMVGGNWVTPVANGGQHVNVVLPVVNMGEDMVTDAVVTPVISSNAAEWPFEIEKSSYTQTISDLPGTDDGGSDMDRRRELTWTLKTRKDAPSGYTKLTFHVNFKNSDGSFSEADLTTYVNVVGTTGSSADGTKSTPRVIVTGFSTDPEVVHAGSTFTLILHMQNTSQSTAVKNMLFDIQAASESTDTTYVAASFLPTSGSSTIFVDKIPAGGTKDISMEMEARSDLAQKPYVVNVTMDYEDENVNAYKNTASVSIPVRQEARVEISSIDVMPEAIDVGSEANVMFSIYNTGKTQLYNTSVKLEAESISGGDAYLGNIAPGATGNVDLYVAGAMATMDEGLVKILITYEDEAGEETTIEKEMTLFVSEPFVDDSFMYDEGMMMGEEMNKKPPIWLIILIAALVLAAGAAGFILIRRRKKKKAAEAEADLLDDELMEDSGGDLPEDKE
ncbi:MAG: hypothetical protein HFI30_09355 [Lachnospiraceae bacterium]|jgi:hypothetical protein|nr:hypothetical protein [Lachnospiraceae bacterium]